MKATPKTGLPYEDFSAEERAKIIGREIRKAIRSGEFDFVQGYLKRIRKPGTATCTYGGCAIAALAFAVGLRPGRDLISAGSVCRESAVDTGLVTEQEAWQLEHAYEGDDDDVGAFCDLGRSLRKYAERRGGRWGVDFTTYDSSAPYCEVSR